MKKFAGWSYFEWYNLPVGLRKYFSSLLDEDLKKEKQAIDAASKNQKH